MKKKEEVAVVHKRLQNILENNKRLMINVHNYNVKFSFSEKIKESKSKVLLCFKTKNLILFCLECGLFLKQVSLCDCTDGLNSCKSM